MLQICNLIALINKTVDLWTGTIVIVENSKPVANGSIDLNCKCYL